MVVVVVCCKCGGCIGRDVPGRQARVDMSRRSKARLPPRAIEQPASPASRAKVVSMLLISSGLPAEAMDGRKAVDCDAVRQWFG